MTRSKTKRFTLMTGVVLFALLIAFLCFHKEQPIQLIGNLPPADVAEIQKAARKTARQFAWPIIKQDIFHVQFKELIQQFKFYLFAKVDFIEVQSPTVVIVNIEPSKNGPNLSCAFEKSAKGWTCTLKAL